MPLHFFAEISAKLWHRKGLLAVTAGTLGTACFPRISCHFVACWAKSATA